MIDLQVRIEGDRLIVGRLQLLGDAARAFAGRSVAIGPSVDYGAFVVQGTPAHVIYPRAKQALFWKGAAHPVRRVNHPGTKANPFMQDALQKASPQAESVLTTAAETVLDGRAGAGALRQALNDAGNLVLREMMQTAPVRTGTLRRSLHTVVL